MPPLILGEIFCCRVSLCWTTYNQGCRTSPTSAMERYLIKVPGQKLINGIKSDYILQLINKGELCVISQLGTQNRLQRGEFEFECEEN